MFTVRGPVHFDFNFQPLQKQLTTQVSVDFVSH